MMRRNLLVNFTTLTLMLSGFSIIDAHEATPQEALMLRRISEFWKDGDYSTVKKQILDYLGKHPETALKDHLNAMLGDIYFQEKNYSQALTVYERIQNPEVQAKIFFNSLQSRFETKDYAGVVEKTAEYLKLHELGNSDTDVKLRRIMAESLFREAFQTSDPERKAHLLKSARPHYKILSQTKYGDRALFPLAEIHRLLKEEERASDLYLLLAKKFPEHKERFLFQAAVLQINFNQEEALDNFGKIYALGGKRAHLAAFNKLVLLYNQEKYHDYVTFYLEVSKTIAKEKAPLLEFYLARSYYELKNYKSAGETFESFVSNPVNRSKEYRIALLLLINCAKYQKDVGLFERSLVQFKKNFYHDRELPKAIMMFAQLCREKGDYVQSVEDLKTILKEFPDYTEREAVLFDYALSLAKVQKWDASRESFEVFLQDYPNSPRANSATRHLINCYIEVLKDPTRVDYQKVKEDFLAVLVGAYNKEDLLNSSEKDKYLLVMVKCLYELGKYQDALAFLEPFILRHSVDTFTGEEHLLMALCFQKMQNLDQFISYAEKALAIDPDLADKEILHLELYNAYLTLSLSENDAAPKDKLLDQAADHLFLSQAWNEKSIKLDNHLWLANYYYQKVKTNSALDSLYEKSMLLYKNLLGIAKDDAKFDISSDSLFLENEVLKFADLIGMKKDVQKQISILEALHLKQSEHTDLPWKLQRRTMLELAQAYEKNRQLADAQKIYQNLIETSGDLPSIVTNTAQLHLARVEYAQLSSENRDAGNEELISILQSLKDLQIQKKIMGEPIHLEAALLYAEIRSELEVSRSKAKSKLFFLKRIKDNFNANEDLITQEYHGLMSNYPEKEKIYQSYMKYIQAEILRCEAELAWENNQKQQGNNLQNEAIRLLDELLKSQEGLKPYLLDRVKNSSSEISKAIVGS
ncbi:MAG TPA: tetratricopeptide repeat protein [Rhabdochlamydiaceae bacterium]|nr:tetratricopeptide repeat protein [Rhabdochlamydiaceae bacterium]